MWHFNQYLRFMKKRYRLQVILSVSGDVVFICKKKLIGFIKTCQDSLFYPKLLRSPLRIFPDRLSLHILPQ
jgi:hypothetical protein